MKKIFLGALFLIGLPLMARADSKLTALTQDTTSQATDIFYKVDDPAGTPESRSISLSSVLGAGATYYVGSTAQYVSSVTANSPLTASTIGTSGSTVTISLSNNLPSGATSYLQNTNSLQSGSTAYPQYLYVGSSATIPILVIDSLGGVLKASSGLVSGSATTSDLTEGTNLYYTTARSTTAISANAPLSNTNGALGISSNLPGGSTSYVGSTALYISSITTNASLNETFTGVSGATVTLSVNVSSISLPNSGVTAASYTSANITVDSHGLVSAATNGSGGGTSIYYATATAAFPYGLSASTVTIGTATALGIISGADRARSRLGGILSLQNVNSDSLTSIDSAGVFTTVASSTSAVAFYTSRRSSGTVASPSATESGQNLLQISAGGYGATNWGAGSTGRMNFIAEEKFTDTSMATGWQLSTTSSTVITPVPRIYVAGSGAMTFLSSATFVSTVTFAGPSYPIRTQEISMGSGLCQLNNGCVPLGQFETTTSSHDYAAVIFQAGTTQYWQSNFYLPDNYVSASTFTFKVQFISTMAVTTNWKIDAACISQSMTADQAWGTAVTITTGSATSNAFILSQESGAVTPSGSCAPGNRLDIRLYRNGDPTGDAYGTKILAYYENFQYTSH